MCDSCRIRHDDMSPSWNTFLGRNWHPRPDSEFTVFNVVIHLNKMKPWAFFHFSPCRLSLVEQLAAIPGFAFFRFSPCRCRWLTTGRSTRLNFLLSAVEPPFSTLIERLTSFWDCNMTRFRLQDMPFRIFQVWSLSFG